MEPVRIMPCLDMKDGRGFVRTSGACLGMLTLLLALAATAPHGAASEEAADREWLVLAYASAINDRGRGIYLPGLRYGSSR